MAYLLSSNIQLAIKSLQKGKFVLIHDSSKRENEIDMVVASEFITPDYISTMRKQAGGLICVCIENEIAKNIGLQYVHDTLFSSNSFDNDLKRMIYGIAPYGDHPTFSMWINHKNTRTGITDFDRTLTIKTISELYKIEIQKQKKFFISSFKTPGHVPLLIAKDGLLKNRQGHTELSVFLTKSAGLIPSAAICEMMDSDTHMALSAKDAQKYSLENNIPFLDLNEILDWI
jgi:3,4-dihydroxy 2-butanone 4-phosphate synthase